MRIVLLASLVFTQQDSGAQTIVLPANYHLSSQNARIRTMQDGKPVGDLKVLVAGLDNKTSIPLSTDDKREEIRNN